MSLQRRKSPVQARSKAVAEALVEATARVLAADGYRGATTRRIAEVAGVSVGSLYQYFPNKEALVFAVAERHFADVLGRLAAVDVSGGRPLRDAVTGFVEAMVEAHALDAGVHRALSEQMLHLGLEPYLEHQRRAEGAVRMLLELKRDEIRVERLGIASWLLVTTVEGAVHRSLLDDPSRLEDPGFVEELVALVCRYLGV